MNYLSRWQINYTEVEYAPTEGFFKTAIISHRLHKLIKRKVLQKSWGVLYFEVDYLYNGGFKPVLTSPTHGTVLMVKEKR